MQKLASKYSTRTIPFYSNENQAWMAKEEGSLCCLWSINRKLLQFVTNGVELSEQHRSKEVVVVIIIELNDIEPTFSMESVKMNAASMYLNDQKCLYTKYRVLLNCLVFFLSLLSSVSSIARNRYAWNSAIEKIAGKIGNSIRWWWWWYWDRVLI